MRPPAGPPPEAILFRASSLSAVDLFGVFNASPNPYVILDLELTIVGCNDAYLRVTGRTRDDIVGHKMFDAFPADPDTPGGRLLRASLAKVIAQGEPDEIALIPYDTSRPGEAPAMRYWSATHTPIRDGEGRLAFILQHTTDVTEVERLRSASAAQNEAGILNRAAAVQAENVALSQQSSQLRRLFQQTPSFMAMVEGPDHVFTLVNDAYSGLVGHRPDLIGKPAAQALPEVVEQGFIALLDQVRTTGEPFIGRAVPILLQQGSGGLPEQRYLDFIYQPIREPDGGVSGIFVQGHDITEQKVAQSELERQREILRLAQEAGGVGTFVWDLVSGYIAGSETFNRLYGVPAESPPQPYERFAKAVHPDDLDRIVRAAPTLEAGVKPNEYRVIRPDGSVRWLQRQGSIIRDAAGKPVQVLGVSFDVTDRKEREAQITLLAQEAAHRVKNMLAMVQGIMAQSLRSATDMKQAREVIGARLVALAEAQDLLTRGDATAAAMADVVAATIRLHNDGDGRFAVEGPDAQLSSKVVLSLGLMLHELATNALKYGALSVPEGRVEITWAPVSMEAGAAVAFTWRELNGPAVVPPDTRGFGSRLIERGVASNLGSHVDLDYAANGFVCRAVIPVES